MLRKYIYYYADMMNERTLQLVKIVKVSANDNTPLIYLPKKLVALSGLEKGCEVCLYYDSKYNITLIKPISSIQHSIIFESDFIEEQHKPNTGDK